MEKAKEILCNGELKVSLVAERVGYKNTAHFKELFKMYTGHTPTEYKKQHVKYKNE